MDNVYFDSIFSSPGKVREWWGPPATYPKGVTLYRQDAPSTNVYFIERGLVKLTRIDEDGHEIIAGIRRRYWLVGAPAVLLKKQYSFNVTTLVECRLRVISADGFLRLVRNDEKFYMELTRILSQEIYEQAKMLISLGCMPARDRLMQLLGDFILEMERPLDPVKQFRLSIPLKHKELAQMIAITPEHLSRLLGRMEAEGFIAREKNAIIIKKSTSYVNRVPI
jgi:CRP/FNR family transcriptional regulator